MTSLYGRFAKSLLPVGCIIMSVMSVGIVYFWFGAHFETNDDPQFVMMFRGLYSAPPTGDLYFWFKFIGRPLRILYDGIPEFPWYAFTLYGLMTASISILLYHFVSLVERIPYLLLKTIAIAVAVAIVFLPHLVLLNFTRVALLASGVGCFGLLSAAVTNRESRWFVGACASLAALGWCVRPESAWLAWLGLLPFAFALLLSNAGIRRLLPFAGTALLFLMLMLIDRSIPSDNDPTEDPRASGLTSVYNFGITSGAQPSRSDVVARRSISLLMWWDRQPDVRTVDRLARYDGDGLIRKTSRTLPRVTRQTASLLYRQVLPVVIFVIAVSVIVVVANGSTARRDSLVFLAANVCFFAGLILVSGVLKFRPRVVNPMIVVCALGNGLFLIRAFQRKAFSGPWWILTLAGMIAACTISSPDRDRLRLRQSHHEVQLTNLSLSSPVALAGSGTNLLDGLDPWAFPHSIAGLQLLPVSTWTSWYPSQQEGLRRFSGSLEFVGVFSSLRDCRTAVVADSATIATMSLHGQTFHNAKLTFSTEGSAKGFEELSYHRRLYRWSVTSITADPIRSGE